MSRQWLTCQRVLQDSHRLKQIHRHGVVHRLPQMIVFHMCGCVHAILNIGVQITRRRLRGPPERQSPAIADWDRQGASGGTREERDTPVDRFRSCIPVSVCWQQLQVWSSSCTFAPTTSRGLLLLIVTVIYKALLLG